MAVMREEVIANNCTFQCDKNVIKMIKTSGNTHQVSALASQQSKLYPMYQHKPLAGNQSQFVYSFEVS